MNTICRIMSNFSCDAEFLENVLLEKYLISVSAVLNGYLYFPAHGPLLRPRPWPQIYLYRPWSQICIYRSWPPICNYRPWHQICIYQPGPKFVFTNSDPQFAFTPNSYLPAQPGLSLHIPTLSPQFVFTGPGLWFVRTQAAKLIYPQWCWIMKSTVL